MSKSKITNKNLCNLHTANRSEAKIPSLRNCQLQTDSGIFRFSSFVLLLSFYILNSTFCISETRYVSHTGTSTPPYTSWETAADSIQKCINISSFGDTIYVANGVYEEQVVMINGLSLIGAGIDSCIISLQFTGIPAVLVRDSCLFERFKIIVPNTLNTWGIEVTGYHGLITANKIVNASLGIYVDNSNATIYNNIIENIKTRGVWLFNSNSVIRKNHIYLDPNSQASSPTGIFIQAFNNNYYPIIDSNYIETISEGIRKSFGTRPTIANNTIVLKGTFSKGIYLSTSDSAKVYNNSIYAVFGRNGIQNFATQYLELNNNYATGNFDDFQNLAYVIDIGPDNIVKNNIVTNAKRGVEAWGTENLIFQYNNVWNNDVNYSGFTPDTTNLSVDPMIVNDDTTQGELDFHLQKYSPLIDAGDPSMFDRDGSRCDIGLYGGPYGWTYTYMDLAPRPPHNITAVYEDGLVKLSWNKNTEADFSHYRIYRDTVSILIYDSTKIVGETSDTLFYDNIPLSTAKKYYYLITAFDNQGNQSPPGEEVNVTVTGLTEHPPVGDDGYRLMSNYPNPFNPSTVIPYRLKEAGYVKLYVYDVKGELVKILVNQWQNKGFYEVVFHPNSEERQRANSYEVKVGKTYSDIATGVYIYHLMIKGEGDIPVFSDMGKMILLK